jgi:hypothetical protein
MQGYAFDRILVLYDVVSAYPWVMLGLPSMRDGRWKQHGRIGLFPKVIVGQSSILSMFRVKWKFPQVCIDGKRTRNIPFNALPYRTKRGHILFPGSGHAWIMRDELLAAFKWVERFFGEAAIEKMIDVQEWSEFIPGNDEKPYAFVAELYEMRREAKSKKEYDIVEQAIKLMLNSLYGETVQSVGGTEDKPPSCACPYYGSAVTAGCRARLLEAALIDPWSVVCFMTDGIVTTRELKGLPRAKEVFNGEPPEGTVMELGDWEFERMQGGFFLQSGVYCVIHKNGVPKNRTRGADPMKFLFKKPLKELMVDDVLPEWKRVLEGDKGHYQLKIELKTYITAGAACASPERFKLIGRWARIERYVDIHNTGAKRDLDKCYDDYFSGLKQKGVIDPKFIKEVAAILDAPQREVAACLRAGEALRCRFLVPFLIRQNDTPDELSWPCEPEWIDPDRDGGFLGEEDRDTADILIGNA